MKSRKLKQDYLSDSANFFGLSEIQLLDAFKFMLTARFIDDRIENMIKQGKATFLISGSGHEAIQVACAMAMKPGKDWFHTYYRDTALGISAGLTVKDFFRHLLSKATDSFTGGRQMCVHIGSKDLRMPTSSSPTGSQYLQAVGNAISCVYRQTDEVVYVSGGEGSTSQGEFFEAVNWASREKLPVIFVIQNNGFAISVPVADQITGGSIFKAISGFDGLNRFHIDGTDFLTSYGTAKEAVRLAKEGSGPSLIYADVVRLRSHSISDAQEKYRSKESLDDDLKNDPVLFLEHKFLYRQGYAKAKEPDMDYYLPFGKAAVKTEGEDITIICYGAMVEKAIRASREMNKRGVSVEVIDLRTIVPLDIETVLASVKKTGKAIVLYEDTRFMGFGAEVVAQIAEQAFEFLDAPIKRVAGLDIPVPYHPNLERAALPQDDWVLKACEEIAAY